MNAIERVVARIKGLETAEQQRWFFANHPEYSSSATSGNSDNPAKPPRAVTGIVSQGEELGNHPANSPAGTSGPIPGFSHPRSEKIRDVLTKIEQGKIARADVSKQHKQSLIEQKGNLERIAHLKRNIRWGEAYHTLAQVNHAIDSAKSNAFYNKEEVAKLSQLAAAMHSSAGHEEQVRAYEHVLAHGKFKRAKKSLEKNAYAAPRPAPLLSRVKDGLAVYKGADGLRYALIVTSNSYKDRDQEFITTKALQEYVDAAWAVEDKCLPRNKALFWHDGDPIGDVVWCDTEGPFLFEVVRERPNRTIKLTTKGTPWTATIKGVWDAIEVGKHRWGASHGFKFPVSTYENGVFKRIAKFETSILPLDQAANPFTFAGVVNDMNKDQVLENILKLPGFAGRFRKGIRAVERELDEAGLEHKEAEGVVVKGIVDKLSAAIDAFLSKVSDSPDPALKPQLMAAIVSAMSTTTDEPESPDEAAAEVDDPALETNEPAMTGKQLKLLDTLVRSQESLVEDSAETRDMLGQVAKAIAPLAAVPQNVQELEKRLGAIEKRLSGAPRRASVDESTVVDDKALTDKAKEQAERYEDLLPGLGVKLKPANGSK